jgi:major membrane immunogen (membrane-anchored lipoprotein)
MKKKVFSIFLVFAIGMLFVGCSSSDSTSDTTSDNTKSSEEYVEDTGVKIESKITEIDVDWQEGNINIEYTEDAHEITFAETSNQDLTTEEVLSYSVDGTELEIDYIKGTGLESLPTKNLSIVIPRDSDVKKINIKNTTGKVTALLNDHVDVDIKSESGDVALTVSDIGFTAEYETTSGNFDSEYKGETTSTDNKENEIVFVHGSGDRIYEVTTTSGNLTISKR